MKEELRDIKKGATWQNLYETLYHIATVRYCTAELLKDAFPKAVWRRKCATPKKLKAMVESGYLRQSETGAIMITKKAINFLEKYSDHNIDIIKLAQGEGDKDTLYNAGIFLQLIQLPDFHALFFPEFYETPSDKHLWLIPDAALLLKKKQKAKLIFIEIEQPKPDWEKHLWGKKQKYDCLSSDKKTWSDWWQNWCKLLNINLCSMDNFGFLIWCIGGKDYGWPGWRFTDKTN